MGSTVEVWKEIDGYNGKYLISSLGNVYSRKTKKNLSVRVDFWGYPAVGLYNGKRVRIHKVHRLLADAFIDNPLGKPCINHIDGNKQNNDLSNLEWVTHKENTLHSKRVLCQNVGGDHHKARMVLDTQTGVFYDTIKDAAWAKGINAMNLVGWLSGYRRNKTSLIYA